MLVASRPFAGATRMIDDARFSTLKASLDAALDAAPDLLAIRLGGEIYAAFAARGLFESRVFRSAHAPIVTGVFPTYAGRAVQIDVKLAGEAHAFGSRPPAAQ